MTTPGSAGPSGPIVARVLLEIGAVLMRPKDPFILTSGRASPVYVDCRKVIGFPRARALITQHAVDAIQREIGVESLDVIAGGETAGIPYAAWIADKLGLPMAYIRKKPKGFGRNAQIKGVLVGGRRRQQAPLRQRHTERRRQGQPCAGGVPLRHLPAGARRPEG